jgi:hypothetical protein
MISLWITPTFPNALLGDQKGRVRVFATLVRVHVRRGRAASRLSGLSHDILGDVRAAHNQHDVSRASLGFLEDRCCRGCTGRLRKTVFLIPELAYRCERLAVGNEAHIVNQFLNFPDIRKGAPAKSVGAKYSRNISDAR